SSRTSLKRQVMSPSQSGYRQRKSFQPLPLKIWSRDPWFLHRPITRCHSTIIFSGGPTSREQTGGIRSGPIAILRERKNIPSSRSPIPTPKHTLNGRGNVCPPKRNSNLPRAVVCLEKHTPGATNFGLTGNGWPTPGRENFQ